MLIFFVCILRVWPDYGPPGPRIFKKMTCFLSRHGSFKQISLDLRGPNPVDPGFLIQHHQMWTLELTEAVVNSRPGTGEFALRRPCGDIAYLYIHIYLLYAYVLIIYIDSISIYTYI